VDRLDQLFARSQREIEAHATEVAATETGRYFIDEAAHLLAGLRLWAQAQHRLTRSFGTSWRPSTPPLYKTWHASCGRWTPAAPKSLAGRSMQSPGGLLTS
jgi:hypothetical protein